MTVKLLLVKSENGLETRQDYDGLSSANPAFTGTLTGGSATLTEFGKFQELPGIPAYGALYGLGVSPTTTNYALRVADDGSDTLVNGAAHVAIAIDGLSKVGVYADQLSLASGVALKMSATTVIDSSRNITGTSLKATGLVAATVRPATIGTDGLLGAQDAATFLATIGALAASLKGVANGVAELGADGRVPSGQLPSYVDDVLEYANFAAFPATGETGKIYVNLDQNKTWRWSGSGYVEISASLALGETSSTAYRGDRGKTAYDHSQISSGNPHNSTPADLGALTAHNPTFTGTLSGPHALLSGVGLFKEDAGNATRGSWYGVGVTPGTNNFAFRAADDGSVAEMNGSSNIGLAIGGTNKVVIGSTAVAFQSGVGLIIADETVISDQREAALYSAQVDALAGAGKGLVLCEADGDLYREALDPATIGAAASAGVTDGSDAASGVVGQYYEAFLPEASFVYAVNGSPVAVLSLSLPAGDWLVEGRATAYITGAMNGNKVVSGLNTSIAIPTDGTEIYGGLQVFSATNGFQTMTGSKRFSLTATTTVYLVAQIDFSAGTPALFGCMSARRMR